jgi:hypothetical protein
MALHPFSQIGRDLAVGRDAQAENGSISANALHLLWRFLWRFASEQFHKNPKA